MDKAQNRRSLDGVSKSCEASSSAADLLKPVRQMHLPSFWTGNRRAWFRQAEVLFHGRRMRCQTTERCEALVSVLRDLADGIHDVLLAVQRDSAYGILTSAVSSLTEMSERARSQHLLTSEELGDRPRASFSTG